MVYFGNFSRRGYACLAIFGSMNNLKIKGISCDN